MRRSVYYSQNFLRPSAFLQQLVAKSSVNTKDTVIDIGAGSGVLTTLLAPQSRKVIAVEADPRLSSNLKTNFATTPNVSVVQADFLEMPLPNGPYKVFANIPFNKTSAIVHKLLDSSNPPLDSYLVMQREAAEKFAGATEKQSLFAILHTPWVRIKIVHRFRASDFTPQPKVATVLLRCHLRSEPILPLEQRPLYQDFVAYIFNHANPNILPSLQKLFPGKQFQQLSALLGAETVSKPSHLPPAAWISLFQAFETSARSDQWRLIKGSAAKLASEAGRIEKHHRTRSDKNWRDVA